MKDIEIINNYIESLKKTLNPKLNIKVSVAVGEEHFFITAVYSHRFYTVCFKGLDNARNELYSLFYESIYGDIVYDILENNTLIDI